MTDARDAWGRPIPERLDRRGKIQCLRQAAGTLQAADDPVHQWIGRCIGMSLQTGALMEKVFGISPPPGSKTSARRIINTERQQVLLLRLSTVLGSDKQASGVLLGKLPVPAEVAEIVDELRRLKAPCSKYAFIAARKVRNPP